MSRGRHEPDLDANCERCGLSVDFSGSHDDGGCIDALRAAFAALELERERPVCLLSVDYPDNDHEGEIVVAVFGDHEDAEREARAAADQHPRCVHREINIIRRPLGLQTAATHGPPGKSGGGL